MIPASPCAQAPFCFFLLLGIKPVALSMLDKHSTEVTLRLYAVLFHTSLKS